MNHLLSLNREKITIDFSNCSNALDVHFLCLPLCPLGCLRPVLKDAKKTNQQCFVRRKKRQPFTRRFAAGPPTTDCPALLESTGSLKTLEVYTPSRGAQTGRSLRLPKLLFRPILWCSAA